MWSARHIWAKNNKKFLLHINLLTPDRGQSLKFILIKFKKHTALLFVIKKGKNMIEILVVEVDLVGVFFGKFSITFAESSIKSGFKK